MPLLLEIIFETDLLPALLVLYPSSEVYVLCYEWTEILISLALMSNEFCYDLSSCLSLVLKRSIASESFEIESLY